MNSLVNNVLKPILLVLAAALLSVMHQGCEPAAKSPEAEYVKETSQCVAAAKTLDESRQCRSKVNWKYGLCPDTDHVGLPCQ